MTEVQNNIEKDENMKRKAPGSSAKAFQEHVFCKFRRRGAPQNPHILEMDPHIFGNATAGTDFVVS